MKLHTPALLLAFLSPLLLGSAASAQQIMFPPSGAHALPACNNLLGAGVIQTSGSNLVFSSNTQMGACLSVSSTCPFTITLGATSLGTAASPGVLYSRTVCSSSATSGFVNLTGTCPTFYQLCSRT